MPRNKKIFSYEEALAALPDVQVVTGRSVAAIEALLDLEGENEEEPDVPQELLPEYQRIVSEWAEAVIEMGIEVKGLWLIDFDSGAGYYCWRYPEPTLEYFHGYEEGFGGRVKLN
ncbi:MAG TPA: DUF2203 family protein [Thermoanaerobaculia bacterium]|nr:DUF2203 family protein [Thermoanaerobaculia bacterium]